MKKFKRLTALVIIVAAFVSCTAAFAAGRGVTLQNVVTDGIRIVIDGREYTCTDARGNIVKPMRYNGTTYIPVRAVSTAFGKAVYWDGENETVYLGKMDGKLEYPTARFDDLTNIAEYRSSLKKVSNIKDIRGGFYNSAFYANVYSSESDKCCEYLLGGQYSRFRAELFVENGANWDGSACVTIVADGREIYVSPEMTKTSDTEIIDVSVAGVDDFKIIFPAYYTKLFIAHEGFYQ